MVFTDEPGIGLPPGNSALSSLPLLRRGWLLGGWCCPLDLCPLLGPFPIPLTGSAIPRGLAIALLWGVTKSLMKRDLDSEVVEGTIDDLLPLLPLSLCHMLNQPSYGEMSPGCAL